MKGNATFVSLDDCAGLILPADLIKLPAVKQVYFFRNTLTITYNESFSSEDERQQQIKSVIAILRTRLPVHDPNFEAPNAPLLKQKRSQQKDRE